MSRASDRLLDFLVSIVREHDTLTMEEQTITDARVLARRAELADAKAALIAEIQAALPRYNTLTGKALTVADLRKTLL